MALSGTTDFESTAYQIVKDALIELNVLREDESLASTDQSFGLRTLNRMIKAWQADDVHLWVKETATIFLQKDQAEYVLNSTGAHATLTYTKTSLDADYALGAAQVSFNDTVTATAGDYIGIVMDDNSLYWDTISNVVDTDTVDLTGTLPSAASENNIVYIYTTRLDQPFNIYSAARRSQDDIDVPMYLMSYEEYADQPNKTSVSTPVNYRYDRQRAQANIAVWPTPADVEYTMRITMSRKIQDVDFPVNNLDFPQEWEEPLVLGLAVRLASAHGKTGTQRFQDLKVEAAMAYKRALFFDSEQGSLFLQPDERG